MAAGRGAAQRMRSLPRAAGAHRAAGAMPRQLPLRPGPRPIDLDERDVYL